jgi:hypothetical protein
LAVGLTSRASAPHVGNTFAHGMAEIFYSFACT